MLAETRVSQDKVFAGWLLSELAENRAALDESDVRLIELPDLDSGPENARREYLLKTVFGRESLVTSLPADIIWHEIQLEAADIDRLFLLPVWDWYLDSGRSFKVSAVPANWADKRGLRRTENNQSVVSHKSKVMQMVSRGVYASDALVLISSVFSGPFTIIDGAHRAVAHSIQGTLAGTRGFLGISALMSQCRWSHDFSGLEDSNRKLAELARLGVIW